MSDVRRVQLHRRFIVRFDDHFLLLALLLRGSFLRHFVFLVAHRIDVVLIVIVVEQNDIAWLVVRLETRLKNSRWRRRTDDETRRLVLPLNRFVFDRLIRPKGQIELFRRKLQIRRSDAQIEQVAETERLRIRLDVLLFGENVRRTANEGQSWVERR